MAIVTPGDRKTTAERCFTKRELALEVVKVFYPSHFRSAAEGFFMGFGAACALRAHARRFVRLCQPQRKMSFYSRLHRPGRLVFQAYACLAVPVVEEVVFRGVVRDLQAQSQRNPQSPSSIAARTAANAALFSAMHVELRQGVRFNAQIFRANMVSGLVFCSLAEVSNNLWGCTVAHSWANYLALRRR
ncbi:MAG: hypothetical protein S4CHLAM2_01020 [Chlamydiales bacterium]|nr:hypothetical protein [Chlamydiales bacterium]